MTDFHVVAPKAGAVSPGKPISQVVYLNKDLHPFAEPPCPLSSSGIPQPRAAEGLEDDKRDAETSGLAGKRCSLVKAPNVVVRVSHLWDAVTAVLPHRGRELSFAEH